VKFTDGRPSIYHYFDDDPGLVIEMAASKPVAHLRSPRKMSAFLNNVPNDFQIG